MNSSENGRRVSGNSNNLLSATKAQHFARVAAALLFANCLFRFCALENQSPKGFSLWAELNSHFSVEPEEFLGLRLSLDPLSSIHWALGRSVALREPAQ